MNTLHFGILFPGSVKTRTTKSYRTRISTAKKTPEDMSTTLIYLGFLLQKWSL